MENQNFCSRPKNHSLYSPIVPFGLAATWLPSVQSCGYIKYTDVQKQDCLPWRGNMLYRIIIPSKLFIFLSSPIQGKILKEKLMRRKAFSATEEWLQQRRPWESIKSVVLILMGNKHSLLVLNYYIIGTGVTLWVVIQVFLISPLLDWGTSSYLAAHRQSTSSWKQGFLVAQRMFLCLPLP